MKHGTGLVLLVIAMAIVVAGCGGSMVTVTATATANGTRTSTSPSTTAIGSSGAAPSSTASSSAAPSGTASSTSARTVTATVTATVTGATTTTIAPVALPTLIVGSWTGTKPSNIDFSGDAGNVVTGIRWSVWANAQALGQGTSVIQNCVPNCAQGTNTPVATTIALSDPQGGHFARMTETRNGQTIVASYGSSQTWPFSAS
ncbi:MAG: hypothetical protein ACLP8S_25360 [Solirubrobacteraceae bacterium]